MFIHIYKTTSAKVQPVQSYNMFTWSKNYLDHHQVCNLDYDLDRNPKDVPVYKGHSLLNKTKRIILLFIVQSLSSQCT